MAVALIEQGIRHVVIKAGERGIFAADAERGERFMIPALKVPVVDTTGAGDNMVAGFMDGLLRGADFRGCCEAGLEAAALSIQHLGATI
jgi:sugar/nucleoside kinase (ribokinase family)